MGNIFQQFQVGLRYDLKGSTHGRTLLAQNKGPRDRSDLKTAMKDNDYIKHVKHITFVEEPSKDNRTMLDILKDDAKFLGRCAIIDYSLLLGEIEDDPEELKEAISKNPGLGHGIYWADTGKPYIVGVIDPLTGFK
jgi:hypothetical protein